MEMKLYMLNRTLENLGETQMWLLIIIISLLIIMNITMFVTISTIRKATKSQKEIENKVEIIGSLISKSSPEVE